MKKIIWPVLMTVREWQIVMKFRWRWFDPRAFIWSRTEMPRYRRWKCKPQAETYDSLIRRIYEHKEQN